MDNANHRSQSVRLSHDDVPVGILSGRAATQLNADRNPMVKSLVDAVDTLEALDAKHLIPPAVVATCKGWAGLFSNARIRASLEKIAQHVDWSAPLPVKVDGVSFGAILGYSKQNSVVCLANDADLDQFIQGKRAVKFGVDVGLEAGKLNRQASLTNKEGQKNDVVGYGTKTYTLSKGFFVDVSLAGSSIETDYDDMASVYGDAATAADVLSEHVVPPREAAIIYHAVKEVEAKFDGEMQRTGSGGMGSPRGRKELLPSKEQIPEGNTV